MGQMYDLEYLMENIHIGPEGSSGDTLVDNRLEGFKEMAQQRTGNDGACITNLSTLQRDEVIWKRQRG
jgi:hypothetical protein